MNTDTLADNEPSTKLAKQSSQRWIKVFLKEEATQQDCSSLCEELKTHPLVKEVCPFVEGMLDSKSILERLRLTHLKLGKKYGDTEEILALLDQRKRDD